MEQRTSERVSHIVPSPSKVNDYDDLKTPALDLDGGVLRGGDAPVYTSPEILALLFQYAVVGVVYGGFTGLKYPILTGYFHLEGNVLNSASSLLSLGWCVKVFFGMLSDCFPIFGYRRKPYILIGWITTAALLVILAIKPAGQPAPDPDSDTNGTVLAMICAVASFTYIMAECAQDALMVSYAQREPIEYRGHLQSLVYTVKMGFVAIITAISGFCLNSERMAGTYDWDIGVNGYMWTLAAPVAINIPIVWFFLKDTKQTTKVALQDYFNQFWQLAQRRAVWQVMIFQFVFTLFTSTIWTTAAPYVSLYWAKVDNLNSALMSIIGNLVYAGVVFLTGKYGAHWNWRYVLVITTVVIFIIDSITQYITIYNIYRNQWFYLGSALTEQVPWGICFVVGTYVIVELAEEGNEGAMYGLLTTITNIPGPFGSMITNVIDANLVVDSDSIQSDTHEARNGVMYSYVIAYCFTLTGCLSVILLPPQKAAVAELKKHGGKYPLLAAFIFFVFFVILFTSLTGTFASMFDSTNCFALAGGSGCPPGTSQLYLLGIFIPSAIVLIAGVLIKYKYS